MSQMPESVLLHKDEKYNTGDYSIAYLYIYINMSYLTNIVQIYCAICIIVQLYVLCYNFL